MLWIQNYQSMCLRQFLVVLDVQPSGDDHLHDYPIRLHHPLQRVCGAQVTLPHEADSFVAKCLV